MNHSAPKSPYFRAEQAVHKATGLMTKCMNDQPKDEKTKQELLQEVAAYAESVGMDDTNKKAMEVLATQGPKGFMKHVFTGKNQDGSERQLSYAEMRSMYG